MKSRDTPIWWLGSVFIAMSALLVGCQPEPEGGDAGAKVQEVKPIAVETMTIKPSRFVQTFEFPGVSQPIEQRRIAAEMGGRVLQAPFEVGDTVKKGELLLRVDAKTTAAQINLLKSQVSTANREYKRVKQLAAEGLATPQQLDQIESQLEQARLALKQAKVGQGMAVVKSPVTGIVAMKFLESGEFAGPGAPIVDLIDTSTMKLEVTVPESAIHYVKIGDEVDVHFKSAGLELKGKVAKRGVMVTQPTQTFPIEIHIANEDGKILPGMRANVVVPKVTIDDAIVVPRDALLEGVFRREAMVLTEQSGDAGKSSLRVVEIGEAKGNKIVITKGLQAGDKLIVLGHRNVVDGTMVRVVKDRDADAVASSAPAKKQPAKEEAAR